jgi:hypothetical protein
MTDIIKQDTIEKKIFLIRGVSVMLDRDLAELYGVETKYLTRQVRRNIERFPEDFMFQLTREEFLRCQIVTSRWGGRRYLPYVFTEQGVAMLSSVLNSKRAIQVNIGIMRVFVNIRKLVSSNKLMLNRLVQLEDKVQSHDKKIRTIFKELKSDGVECELRVIIDNKLNADIHDRWIISENICYNMPSTDTIARGQYSEVKRTANFPPFNEWWGKSKDI